MDKIQILTSLVLSATGVRLQIYSTRGGHAYHNSTYQVPKGGFVHWIVLLKVDIKKWFCIFKHQFKYGIHLHSRLKSTVNFKKRKVRCLQCQVCGFVLYIWLFSYPLIYYFLWFTITTNIRYPWSSVTDFVQRLTNFRSDDFNFTNWYRCFGSFLYSSNALTRASL